MNNDYYICCVLRMFVIDYNLEFQIPSLRFDFSLRRLPVGEGFRINWHGVLFEVVPAERLPAGHTPLRVVGQEAPQELNSGF